MKKLIYSIPLIFLLACSTVPITGRKQVAFFPTSELMASSFSSYEQVLDESKLSKDREKVAMVREVGNNIKNAVEKYMKENNHEELLKGFEWEFNLIEEDIINAWCMPGGKVAFYTGILPICDDKTGIAVVMGHEVAHAVAGHGEERMSQGLIQQGLGAGLAIALKEQPAKTQNLALAAYTGASTLGVLKYSRLHESEADHMGLIFMAMAGYNPEEAPKFWQRMSKASQGSAPPEFLSTHPSHSTRISDLKKWMPEAKQYYKR